MMEKPMARDAPPKGPVLLSRCACVRMVDMPVSMLYD